ncbi:hypothetical protein RintRC_5142 [Richelia intracellularis]|nr:hypothetical protein RintRC_5142 [Richelia intracellularis]
MITVVFASILTEKKSVIAMNITFRNNLVHHGKELQNLVLQPTSF